MSFLLISLLFTCVAVTCTGEVDTRGSNNVFVFNIPVLWTNYLDYPSHVLIKTSSPSPISTTLTISGLGFEVTNSVTRDNPVDIVLSSDLVGINVRLSSNETSQNKTLVLRAAGDVSVNVVENDLANTDAFTISPTSHLGTAYRVASYTPLSVSWPSFWSLSAVYSDTVVDITTVSGQHRQVVLQRFESARFDGDVDPSGTLVVSNRPVVVIGGAWTWVPAGKCCTDGLLHQLSPVESWGDQFTLTPFLSLNSGYVYRVFTDSHSVTLRMTDGTTERVEAGSFYEGDVAGDTITSFTSDKPVMVAQYMKGRLSNDPGRGNPSMVIVPPMTSFRTIVTFYVFWLAVVNTYYINVVADCDNVDGLWLDGSKLMDIATSTMIRSQEHVCCARTNVSSGSHIVRGSNPFYYVIVYGIGDSVSSSYLFAANTFGEVGNGGNTSTTQTDAPLQPESAFVGHDVTLTGCSITRTKEDPSKYEKYDTIKVYQQYETSSFDETAIKIAVLKRDDRNVTYFVSDDRYTFTLTTLHFGAELQIRTLSLNDSGSFWCVFEGPNHTNMATYAEILLRVNPCAGRTYSLATEKNVCTDLEALSQVNITTENVVEVAAILADATDREDGIYFDEDIQIVGDILEEIVNVGDGSAQVTRSVVDTVSNVLYAPDTKVPPTSEISSNRTTRITQAVEEQVFLRLQQNDMVHAVESNVAVQAFRVNSSVLQDETFDGIGFGILTDSETELSDNSTRMLYKKTDIEQYAPTGYIFLSSETVQTWSDKASNISFAFLAYRNDFLFPSVQANETKRKVEGFILTANVESEVPLNVDSLSHPVIIQHRIDPQEWDSGPFPQRDCVYWDFNVNASIWDWSSEGCTYVKDVIEEGRGVCSCTHLTNFAVLVYHGKEIINNTTLDMFSKIGCIISLVALIVTVFTLTLVRRLKLKRSNRGRTASSNNREQSIHYFRLQLCASLIAVYVVFLAAFDRTVPVLGCTVAAVFLHCFLLVSMASMAVQARYMYIKLVTWQRYAGGSEPNLVFKAAAMAFGVPVIIVAIALGADHNDHYCFPQVGPVVHYAVLLPIAIVLIHNLLSAVLIIIKGICQSLPGAGGTQSDNKDLINRLRQSTAISCLLGLTWIFGFFAIEEATLYFQWLFCISNSLQDLFIFIFFVCCRVMFETLLLLLCVAVFVEIAIIFGRILQEKMRIVTQ